MLFGTGPEGVSIRAQPGVGATCPGCGAGLTPKCGQIVTWHWAHPPRASCSASWEPETEWHRRWKSRFPADRVEVLVEREGQRRFADAVDQDGCAIEFQHSSIGREEVARRTRFYGRGMVWIFDARRWHLTFAHNFEHTTFRWKWARRTLEPAFEANVLFDLGERLFLPRKVYWDPPVAGWGVIWAQDQFLRRVGVRKEHA